MMDFLADLTAFLISGKKESPLGSVVTWLPWCHLALATLARFCLKSEDVTEGADVPNLW